jgi:hypothetical protein
MTLLARPSVLTLLLAALASTCSARQLVTKNPSGYIQIRVRGEGI